MREILFRGKNKLNGIWVYGDLRNYEKSGAKAIFSHELLYRVEVDPETVGQYTGLIDKNGTKIFEGDIIKTVTNSFDRDEFITEIKFGARSGIQGFYLANGRMMFYFGQKDLTVMDDTEVIGNRHDNPELLRTPQNEVRE